MDKIRLNSIIFDSHKILNFCVFSLINLLMLMSQKIKEVNINMTPRALENTILCILSKFLYLPPVISIWMYIYIIRIL